MSQKDKLIVRLKSKPKDFTFDEAKALLESCGYIMSSMSNTSDSFVCFIRYKKVFRMHKPQQRTELSAYQVKELIDELEQEDLL